MHELTLTRSIIEACSERAGGAPVRCVTVEVGRLTCVMPQALRFCFEACREGTPLAGAELEIITRPGEARCRDCGRTVAVAELLATCACGSADLTEPRGGDRLCVRSMEIDEAPAPAAPVNGE